ncbi:transmembrane protein [Perilla frutescens var. hirtella]|nr:transmembrane protein [Perilla frutescens var. hirtella]
MAITHADVARRPKCSNLGSKSGAFLMLLSILLGLFCFILCLIAEAARSQLNTLPDSQCTYSASGKLPLFSATAAFAALAAAMLLQHVFLLVAVSKSDPLLEIACDPHSAFARTFTWQFGFFFVATWVSFAVGEIELLIGLSVESGHLKNWDTPRPSCLIIRQGLFTAAGVLGLATVFFASGLYITALRAERYVQNQENTRREILEVSVMYASPPRSPGRNNSIRADRGEGPLPRQDDGCNLHTLNYYLRALDKQSRFV